MSSLFQKGFENLHKAYKEIDCPVSLNVDFLHLHLHFFLTNLGAVSDGQVKRFYWDIQSMEARYEGFWNERMMSDYCWMLCSDDQSHSYKPKIVFKAFLGDCSNLLNNKETLLVMLYVAMPTQNAQWVCIELLFHELPPCIPGV